MILAYKTLNDEGRKEIVTCLEAKSSLAGEINRVFKNLGGAAYHVLDATVFFPYNDPRGPKWIDISALDDEKIESARSKLEEISNVELNLT